MAACIPGLMSCFPSPQHGTRNHWQIFLMVFWREGGSNTQSEFQTTECSGRLQQQQYRAWTELGEIKRLQAFPASPPFPSPHALHFLLHQAEILPELALLAPLLITTVACARVFKDQPIVWDDKAIIQFHTKLYCDISWVIKSFYHQKTVFQCVK